MPYKAHPVYTTPPGETVIWRYMDFARFVQLLVYQELWFARADTFEDPLEGTYTDAELDKKREEFALLIAAENGPGVQTLKRDELERLSFAGMSVHAAALMRYSTYVSCWRMSPNESLAMWDLYGKGSGIVAIKSTIMRLRQDLDRHPELVWLLGVNYVDWSQSTFDKNFLQLFIRKDRSYEHEAEVRAIVLDVKRVETLHRLPKDKQPSQEPPFGKKIKVDPSNLISEIVVGPREKSWVPDLVRRVLEKYELGSVPVTVSDRLRARDVSKFRP